MSCVLYSVVVCVTLCVCYGWNNEYDKVLNFRCQQNFSVSEIESIHDNGKEDRLFSIHCRYAGATTGCHWSGFVNSFDEFFAFECSNHGFIHGLHSVHDNGHEDRRWDFYCCEKSGFTTTECYHTTHTNYDSHFDMTVPDNFVLRGVTSTHNNGYEDRVYSFELCKLREY